jgi:hypothetical protein
VKFAGDGSDAKRENEEIEGIERPAQEAGDERVALSRGKPPEMRQKFYRSLLSCSLLRI